MSDRKLAKRVKRLFRLIGKLYRSLSKSFVTWLLRSALLTTNRRRRPAQAGFVLPTTIFLILVVTLTAGALSYRAFTNSSRVIGNVQSKAIYNAATPAIDRARAKLDYLFGKDPRLPGGVPSEEFIISMMLNNEREINGTSAPKLSIDVPGSVPGEPYQLEDETPVDINGDGNVDNAWVFTDRSTGNSVIYSINLSTPDDEDLGAAQLLTLNETEKATGDAGGPYVRTGPLSESKAVNCPNQGVKVEGGWYEDNSNSAILRKRFQVDAFVVNPQDVAAQKPGNYTTLEFYQDRKLDRGNKWGAWFQYDLEIHSGTPMNWNGAMHSEGNIMIGNNTFTGYLISSPASCVFLPESNSEISVRQFARQNDNPALSFFGAIAAGIINSNTYGGFANIHTYNGKTYQVPAGFEVGTDWATGNKSPIEMASDPKQILTDGVQQARGGDATNVDGRIDQAGIEGNVFYKRRFLSEDKDSRPYVDDTYRADNLWGPKVRYSTTVRIPPGTSAGTAITGNDELTRQPTAGQKVEPGLDGYWERRTFANTDVTDTTYSGGMRILVGERLQLGNPFGWMAPQDRPDTGARQNPAEPVQAGDGSFTDLRRLTDPADPTQVVAATNPTEADFDLSDNEGDPLNPPYSFLDTPNRAHEARQRRALRDNLAAVQASAIYHYKVNDGAYPAACLLTTTHPGTPYSLQQSLNFTGLPNGNQIPGANGTNIDTRFDLFYGKGTNGWEFAPPPEADLVNASPLRTALQNLARFAGDPYGAFPPLQEAGKIHPDPTLTMWGNFSNLRRALDANYADLSPAGKSYLHTAGCTVSALAYNISQIQNFDPSSANNTVRTRLRQLANEMATLMDGVVDPANGNFEVLPKSRLATYGYNEATPDNSPTDANFNPRDYDRVTPDMFLAALKQRLEYVAGAEIEQSNQYHLYQLAVLIHENFQIRRDRTYGFRPSPAANTWNYNPYLFQFPNGENGGKVTLWSSACDPHIFNVGSGSEPPVTAGQGAGGANIDLTAGATARRRLYLSRLCGTVIPSGAVHDFPGDYNFPARGVTSPFTPALSTADEPVVRDIPRFISDQQMPQFAQAPLNANSEAEKLALVAPKYPSLYYIFPEVAHDQAGTGGDQEYVQPGNTTLGSLPAALQPWPEPYITASEPINAGADDDYQVVNGATLTHAPASFDYEPLTGRGVQIDANKLPNGATFTYRAFQPFKIADTSVDLGQSATAYTPRADLASWVLPNSTKNGITVNVPDNNDDAPPNLIRLGDPGQNSTIAAIPFLDRVMFNGREWLPSRVLDIDLEMLRTSQVGGDDYWLPVSGVVYAFREDARREDAIARPPGSTFTNAQTVGGETDPALEGANNISVKAVDFFADPDRRVHGFRLRRGDVLRRPDAGIPPEKNIRGMTFVTDNLAYIMGHFNRHQATKNGGRLEEFDEQLPNDPAQFNVTTFYDNRVTPNPNFAKRDGDLWRPTEVLADGITILSNNFCDGSVLDAFMNAGYSTAAHDGGLTNDRRSGSNATQDAYQGVAGAEVYNEQQKALFGPGCRVTVNAGGATSFLNQNRPRYDLADVGANPTPANPQWNWMRENPADPMNSPVKVSRNGNGLISTYRFGGSELIPADGGRQGTASNKPFLGIEYGSSNDLLARRGENAYFRVEDDGGEDQSRPLQEAVATDVNAILISGIIPSRQQQGYGGMHNFPRLLEWWRDRPLRIQGSFLQLNFSNYGTAPYDQDRWEPNGGVIDPVAEEQIDYYGFAPLRLWGYDVALQLAPASPAATRFTTPSSERNEFYDEPRANDPYMQRLCGALKQNAPGGADLNNLNCPT